ncbi:toxin-antitoxin system HicB family antitoxin [Actinophytocola sp.]|uniref:toxin-antitoxin system HicB family antitoxin n=1 Tax=Actinophytocola sp. TaxID=1872138 RepID=UPI002D801DEF|nr:toxin-antitoxin system HicB family antitoxin [Actinophytocola sp.]HET9142818.1 toxin-antitoxin system HicB family antitoxin [Actinophytocola sp.]
MITRIEDELHARIKAQAASEGRSVNEFVVRALILALDGSTGRQAVRERARATGRLVVPEPPVGAVVEGRAVSAALAEERSAR